MKKVGDHLQHFYEPKLQRPVLRILWMPVVFGVDNWVALRWTTAGWGSAGVYMGVLTGWYEAWVLQSFYNYLETYLEGDNEPGSLAKLPVVTETPEHKHIFPFGCFRPWRMTDGEFIFRNKVGVLQYTLVQTVCTLVTFAAQLSGKYHDGDTSAKYAYVWVTVLINVSQVIALYCLILFYKTLHEPLLPMRPFAKFMCVKLVIFFSFWQEMAVAAAVKWGLIKRQESWAAITIEQAGAGIQVRAAANSASEATRSAYLWYRRNS
jgi:Organic solute transporter Ostalpha